MIYGLFYTPLQAPFFAGFLFTRYLHKVET